LSYGDKGTTPCGPMRATSPTRKTTTAKGKPRFCCVKINELTGNLAVSLPWFRRHVPTRCPAHRSFVPRKRWATCRANTPNGWQARRCGDKSNVHGLSRQVLVEPGSCPKRQRTCDVNMWREHGGTDCQLAFHALSNARCGCKLAFQMLPNTKRRCKLTFGSVLNASYNCKLVFQTLRNAR
jgi:hypothetical protein